MAIRKSTLKYFAESVVESLEEVASKIETIENIISGEDDNANGVSDDVEPDYESEETVVHPVYDETTEEETEEYDNPEDYVADTETADDEDEEEEVVESEANDDEEDEDDEAEEENYSRKTKKVKKVTNFSANNKKPTVQNFAANRYAKVKEFLNGAM